MALGAVGKIIKDGENSSMIHTSANLEPCLTLPSALQLLLCVCFKDSLPGMCAIHVFFKSCIAELASLEDANAEMHTPHFPVFTS